MRRSNHNNPSLVVIPGVFRECAVGWNRIAEELQRATAKRRTEKPVVVVECYPGVDELAVLNELESRLAPAVAIRAGEAYHSPERLDKLVAPFLAGDHPRERFNGVQSPGLSLVNFFDAEPLWRLRRMIDELKSGLVLIVGCGASLIAWGHVLIHADVARRQTRRRFHGNEIGNLGVDNKTAPATFKSDRASRIDWPIADRWKRPLIKRWDYVLDTNDPAAPKLVDAADVRCGLQAAAKRPFRLVSCGDPDCETQTSAPYLDCLWEENSLLLGFAEWQIEVPAVDLVFYQPHALLGEAVHARFGYALPSCFSFLKPASGPSELLAHDDGWREECVGFDERNSIETRRHWFSKTVVHETRGGVNVLKLIAGEEAIMESPHGAFEPSIIHCGETFIVPAAVGSYRIRPHGPSAGTEIVTINASVRIQNVSK